MYWNSDSYVNPLGAQFARGSGFAFSANWFFANRFIPFFRAGFSDGDGENAFYKRDIQIGHGYRLLTHDIIGIAVSFAEPNIPDTKDQTSIELFYRFNLNDHLAFTPDFQFIFNPTLNPTQDFLMYWGIRGRITL